MKSKKLLAPDEQSLLLVSLLFARKHLDEIYSFFSESQSERMKEAKSRFLRLEQGPRVTQIILELRRLLLIKENDFCWIHQSWFEHELAKEPPYLRAIIEPALRDQTRSSQATMGKTLIAPEQVLQYFLTSFVNTPQRVALFDPVLIRLQSLQRDHHHVITTIGHHTLCALTPVLDTQRFTRFMHRSFAYTQQDSYAASLENPLKHEPYKRILVKALLDLRKKTFSHKIIASECGLWLLALYLGGHKRSWHRMLELVLERSLGMSLREKLALLASDKPDPGKIPLTKLLVNAMDQAQKTS